MSIVQIDRFSNRSRSRHDENSALRGQRDAFPSPAPTQSGRAMHSIQDGSEPIAPSPLPIEIAFLASDETPLALLQYAAALARRQGVTADAALIAEGLIDEESFYRALAAHLDVPFIDEDAAVSTSDAIMIDAGRGYVRLADHKRGLHWLVAPRGATISCLFGAAHRAQGRPLFSMTTPSRFKAALRAAVPRELAQMAALSAERADRDLCARAALRSETLAPAIGGATILLAGLFSPFEPVSLAAALAITAMFLGAVCLRLFACVASFDEPEQAPDLDDAHLPHYSIVIALYREARVARQLTCAIDCLDYPRAKLNVKFVVEYDDAETAQALRDHPPRTPHEIIVAPRGAPRTKPRALNVAMPHICGDIVAVFDAEDLPERDQLKKAAAAFAQSPQSVACLQANLCIDNGGENWIAGLFAIDYAALFEVFNKGVANMGQPLFLGGTSNHFRYEALREVGFWDAYNVTEDADLGLRLARAGFTTKTFSSRTFEEAPTTFPALLRQRTRWLKGWMQTALVHCRNPLRLVVDLGLSHAMAVLAMFAGSLAGPLLGPAFLICLIRNAWFGRLLAPATPSEIALSTLWCVLAILGVGAVLWPLIIGMQRQSHAAHWPALFCLPLWMAMLSLAAWRAVFELCVRPYHWDKTTHGLSRRRSMMDGDGATLGEQPLFE
jgi:cellulose synthase/poly-beta-1,6-N-acetylglucosamine synthase-like glycosyltransferase